MRRKSNIANVLIVIVLAAIAGAAGFIYLSPQFEQNKPLVDIDNRVYWNLKDPLKVNIKDSSGIKFFKVTYKDDRNEKVLKKVILENIENSISIDIKAPKLDMFFKGKEVSLIVEAFDNSKWNFFEGNYIRKEFKLRIDKKSPTANVVANSLAIRKGGSAVVIVEVKDKNLQDAYISFNKEERFDLIPFYKENYFIALIAWPVTIKDFMRVNLVAIDKANNISRTKVPLYIRNLKMKNSNIKITDDFISNISSAVLEKSGVEVPSDLTDIFVKENNVLRNKNVQTIKEVSRKFMDKEMITNFSFNPIRRLSGSKTVAGFADRRHYYYNGEKVDTAWHLGMDWASIKRAAVKTSNEGTVIFNDYLGIYGNTIIVDHKLGIQTLYAHTSKSHVSLADEVSRNTKIANTGSTGAVFGDHLHLGVLIQGIEVNPLEWMDKNWIKTRVLDVIKEAKKVIDSK